jgi:hypothetical protein
MPVTRSQRNQPINNLQDECVNLHCHDKVSCEDDTLCLTHKIAFIRQEYKAHRLNAYVIRRKNKNPKYVHKYCSERTCENLPVFKGKCARHSGKFFCNKKGCRKLKQRGGFCVRHGGIHTQSVCRTPGCKKYNQGGGYCRSHGGGRRCKASENCVSHIIPELGICKKHLNKVPTQVIIDRFIRTI